MLYAVPGSPAVAEARSSCCPPTSGSGRARGRVVVSRSGLGPPGRRPRGLGVRSSTGTASPSTQQASVALSLSRSATRRRSSPRSSWPSTPGPTRRCRRTRRSWCSAPRPGRRDGAVGPVDELDRVEPDHLTSIYIPALAEPIARRGGPVRRLVAALRPGARGIARNPRVAAPPPARGGLRGARGHRRPRRGVRHGVRPPRGGAGRPLFQVLFHSQLAAEQGRFTLADVATTVHDKLRSRHPHVFGESRSAAPTRWCATGRS